MHVRCGQHGCCLQLQRLLSEAVGDADGPDWLVHMRVMTESWQEIHGTKDFTASTCSCMGMGMQTGCSYLHCQMVDASAHQHKGLIKLAAPPDSGRPPNLLGVQDLGAGGSGMLYPLLV